MSQAANVISPPAVTLDAVDLARLRDAIRFETVAAFVQRSGASQAAVLRAASGLPIRRGTVALIRAALAGDEQPGSAA